jgi:hypothetical protein
MLIKASFVFNLIKAIFPLIIYGGEPSVSIGIVSQLPSYHLSIHRVPAKLADRVMPYGNFFCWLQLLFVIWFSTDLASFATYLLMDAGIATNLPVWFSLSMQYCYSIC